MSAMIGQRLLLLNKGRAEPPLRWCHLSPDLKMMLEVATHEHRTALRVASFVFFFISPCVREGELTLGCDTSLNRARSADPRRTVASYKVLCILHCEAAIL